VRVLTCATVRVLTCATFLSCTVGVTLLSNEQR
jgi:hypothetical protein